MRRKSERKSKVKASPEKTEAKDVKKRARGRPSRRRKHSSSSEPEPESSGGEHSPAPELMEPIEPVEAVVVSAEAEVESEPAKLDTASAPTDEEPQVWQVKAAGGSGDSGEIKKLKICLTRPPSTPERPDRSPRGRRKLDRTGSSDVTTESGEERRRTRHRSKRGPLESKDEKSENDSGPNEEPAMTHDDIKETLEVDVVPPKFDISAKNETTVVTTQSESLTLLPKLKADELGESIKTSEIDKKIVSEEPPNSEESLPKKSSGSNEPAHIQEASPTEDASSTEDALSLTTKNTLPSPPKQASPSPPRKDSPAREVLSPPVRKESPILEHNTPSPVKERENDISPEINLYPVNQTTLAKEISPGRKESPTRKVSMNKETLPAETSAESTNKVSNDAANNCKDTSPKNVNDLTMPQCDVDEVFEERTPHESDQIEERKVDREFKEKRSNKFRDNNCATKQNHNHVSHSDNRKPINDDKRDDSVEIVKTADEITLENYQANPIVVSRKRKWGTRAAKTKQPQPVSISTDILKEIIPDVKPAELEEVIKDKREERKSRKAEKIEKKEKMDRPILPKIVIDNTEQVNKRRDSEREKTEITTESLPLSHRKISIVKDDKSVVGRPPSPPKHKSTAILYITNLVRPFTLNQLKNLLQRTGRIAPDGFWIDNIKSKCFVKYETDDQAIETRHALHGVTWPVSNPKTLQVDFCSQETMDKAKASEEANSAQKSNIPGTVEDWLREQDAKKERFGVELVEPKPWERKNIVREWDVGKGEKEKERIKQDEKIIDKRRRRSSERSPEPARKFKKKEEEAPAKMLDDLFRKTKAVPCIYWLPLSAETIAIKEEQRRKHMEEHERRLQELSRPRIHRRN